jgi:1-acyl-sn-glycerol-3-phosphate acyltransferase
VILVSLLATASAMVAITVATIIIGGSAVIAGMIGFPDGPGSPYHVFAPAWSKVLLFFSFVGVRAHNRERSGDGARIYVVNHMSYYDVPVLSSFIPRAKFVTKEELFSIPIFGKAMKAIGMVPISRDNKRAAFSSYDAAARSLGNGNSIVVFAEGTRGTSYGIRPLKKGPFVLAITAGVPIIPVLIHGTHEVLPRGSIMVTPRTVDVHFLEPVPVEGLGLSDRDQLASEVWSRLAGALRTHYGIESIPQRSHSPAVAST